MYIKCFEQNILQKGKWIQLLRYLLKYAICTVNKYGLMPLKNPLLRYVNEYTIDVNMTQFEDKYNIEMNKL